MNIEYQKAKNLEAHIQEIYNRIDEEFKSWIQNNSTHYDVLTQSTLKGE